MPVAHSADWLGAKQDQFPEQRKAYQGHPTESECILWPFSGYHGLVLKIACCNRVEIHVLVVVGHTLGAFGNRDHRKDDMDGAKARCKRLKLFMAVSNHNDRGAADSQVVRSWGLVPEADPCMRRR